MRGRYCSFMPNNPPMLILGAERTSVHYEYIVSKYEMLNNNGSSESLIDLVTPNFDAIIKQF